MTIKHANNEQIPDSWFQEIQGRFEAGDYTQVQGATFITRIGSGIEFIGEGTGRLDEQDEIEIQWRGNDGEDFEIGECHTPRPELYTPRIYVDDDSGDEDDDDDGCF